MYILYTHLFFATHVAPGATNPTSFCLNGPIVLFKSFQSHLQTIASSSVNDRSRLCQNHKITSLTSTLIQFHNMEKQVKSSEVPPTKRHS